jgi:hypothetical protein
MSESRYSGGVQQWPEFIRGASKAVVRQSSRDTFNQWSPVGRVLLPGFSPMNSKMRSCARESRSGIGRWAYADGGAYPAFLRGLIGFFGFFVRGVLGGVTGVENGLVSMSSTAVAEYEYFATRESKFAEDAGVMVVSSSSIEEAFRFGIFGWDDQSPFD